MYMYENLLLCLHANNANVNSPSNRRFNIFYMYAKLK